LRDRQLASKDLSTIAQQPAVASIAAPKNLMPLKYGLQAQSFAKQSHPLKESGE
jgi:hypothetical protein